MILCIDTCTAHAGVALVKKARAVYKPLPEGRYAEMLLRVIDKVFKAAKAKSADLTSVLVIKGPGSFTSLRVGISVANQFAHQLKIPIIGLRTDEWWRHRVDDGQDVVYLQSMNREEIYTVSGIVPISSLKQPHQTGYLGELSQDHQAQLPLYQLASDLKTIEETWVAAAKILEHQSHRTYDLVEPFYGKEPTITKLKPKF